MQFRKLSLIGLAVGVLLFVNVDAVLASETSYDYKNDPYLLEWSLVIAEQEEKEEPQVLSAEEKMLARWKEKQAAKWLTLPDGTFTVNASAYTASADECGNANGITASGLKVAVNRTIACPPEFPFGTMIHIEGMGDYRCEDRGGAIKGNKIDIYVETKKEAFAFGRQNLTAQVIR